MQIFINYSTNYNFILLNGIYFNIWGLHPNILESTHVMINYGFNFGNRSTFTSLYARISKLALFIFCALGLKTFVMDFDELIVLFTSNQ